LDWAKRLSEKTNPKSEVAQWTPTPTTKTNPKRFRKYVNSKTKHSEKIGDLKKKNEQGDTVICSMAETKADLC